MSQNDRVYTPQAPWISKSHLSKFIQKTGCRDFEELLSRSQKETEWFWTQVLDDLKLDFAKPYSKLLSQGLPFPKWVEGAQISIVENCIDRHARKNPKKTALLFEADSPGASQKWTYEDLSRESQVIAELLSSKGANKGDKAVLLMPMSLEMVASFFGVLRAGLTVVPVFSGFGVDAIASRVNDAQARFIFVQEKTFRRAKEVNLDQVLSEVQKLCPSVEQIFRLNREEFRKGHSPKNPPESKALQAEETCLLLYTSGTTGKPKACVHTPFGLLATCGKEHRYSFDVHESDVFFWYTDIGWMMGPWELFGALQAGASVLLYEGVPDYPEPDRLWKMIEEHRVTQFGISPTAIRVLKNSPLASVSKYPMESLRILGSTGEPWDEESWIWFFENVGKKRCPIINISGGTEICGCLLMPTPLSALKPCTLGGPGLGVAAEVWSESGESLQKGLGYLVCLSPLPSMTKGFLHSKELYLQTYFEKFGEKVWNHGDWAFIDDEGYWFLRGRSDDTIKIAGKRIGPNEYESALMEDAEVAECAAVGVPHSLKGECVHMYVVLKKGQNSKAEREVLARQMLKNLTQSMGKAMAPEKILFVESLPKTRSGKILRSLIRKISLGEKVDTASVENLSSVEAIRKAS